MSASMPVLPQEVIAIVAPAMVFFTSSAPADESLTTTSPMPDSLFIVLSLITIVREPGFMIRAIFSFI